MNIAIEHTVGIIKNSLGLIGKYYFNLGTAFTYKVTVIRYLIDTGKFMLVITEQLSVAFKSKHI